MLSINIPVYNVLVVSLVEQLLKQVQALPVPVEIRVYDDGSEAAVKAENRVLQSYPGVIYAELEHNIGRSAIRNRMGLDSGYDYLLFVDADSLPADDHYLQRYLNACSPNRVVCGGTVYTPEKPDTNAQLLRWTYGSRREAVSAEVRNEKKGFIITSNNFLIARKVFEQIHFREELTLYGHEDTLLGYDLYKAGIEVFHLPAPVIHTGLEDARAFIGKTKQALENLHYIVGELLADDPEFGKQVNFLRKYRVVKSLLSERVIGWLFKRFEKRLVRNLQGEAPRLICFDLYKIGYFSLISIIKKRTLVA